MPCEVCDSTGWVCENHADRPSDTDRGPPQQLRDVGGDASRLVSRQSFRCGPSPGFLHYTCGARDLARADKIERIKELRRARCGGRGRQDIPTDNNHAPAAMRTMPARGAI